MYILQTTGALLKKNDLIFNKGDLYLSHCSDRVTPTSMCSGNACSSDMPHHSQLSSYIGWKLTVYIRTDHLHVLPPIKVYLTPLKTISGLNQLRTKGIYHP